MNNQEKLLSLLQPKDYVSKIKLYCKDCETKGIIVEKVQQDTKPRVKRIKIIENEK